MSDFAPFAGQRLLPAEYLDRPSRFLVHCRLEDGQRVRAFLPNPGRMWELLLPGARLQVVEVPAGAGAGGRRTRFTAVAVERAGAPVLLDTPRTTRVARHLIESGLVPGLEGATIAGAEVAVGRSRFDFLLRQGRREAYLEVKSCTLFGNRVAMFPDAVTERGRRHLAELAHLGERGTRPAVLFVVHSWDVDWFMPDYHTDLEFSRAFLEVRRDLRI
ncbi:MAG: DNA/RNA nuclease SfsA, partial [Gemmatimonadota bacterium]